MTTEAVFPLHNYGPYFLWMFTPKDTGLHRELFQGTPTFTHQAAEKTCFSSQCADSSERKTCLPF